ncbi:MAG: hypothetical protein JOY59_07060 [Candidatus Eremiobacteraeota bacterium]|nr:hypothetical protein [Candidatus Eremiobacteraeota bacterium]
MTRIGTPQDYAEYHGVSYRKSDVLFTRFVAYQGTGPGRTQAYYLQPSESDHEELIVFVPRADYAKYTLYTSLRYTKDLSREIPIETYSNKVGAIFLRDPAERNCKLVESQGCPSTSTDTQTTLSLWNLSR